MLNIENYDQWKKVCDDDDLIQVLHDQGVRPGTKEFEDLLGQPYIDGYNAGRTHGRKMGIRDTALVLGALGFTVAVVGGSVVLVKRGYKKIKGWISKRIQKKREEPK